ncbi:sugar phosphate nucleotidyltransferase [Clostridium frigoris]|uniref:sugar phosphate nucleotidyltransferase n=1 Tax=Clostridium frigoris TaxID=205327 RepID=UPI001FE97F61|nr:sugar phosphate nucleotidyltransferase [Clostridium frigoris]
MKKEMVAMILAGGQGTRLKMLTKNAAKPAIPFKCKYKIIDLPLSNCSNSGIDTVEVLTQYQPLTLTSHIEIGIPWDLDRRLNGLFVFNFGIASNSLNDAEILWSNMEYLYRSKEKNIILSPSYMLGNIDYIAAVKYHENKKQDITVIYKNINTESKNFLNCDVLNIDENNNVLSVGKNTVAYNNLNISMEIFIIKKELLILLIIKLI